ncbi:hypothetical protein RJ639_034431 [Escallonia herrerae]|uniref:Exocyst subunit Exo70 family protein n=1 Tax=Escallonia herrerae TaxID=1293975 RepID=A0AA88WSQ8_9ASTE|nr:hypothetical protein RJ639_034431 [Escallonia herrerae]
MEKKNRPNKFGSFTSRTSETTSSPRSPYSPLKVNQRSESDTLPTLEEDELHDHDIGQVSEDIDRFTDALSAVDDKSDPPEVPDIVETFSRILDSKIAKYNSGESTTRFFKMTEEDLLFIEAVRRISKLTNAFGEFPSSSTTTSSHNRTSMVLQRAMTFMEDEFRALLEDSWSSDSSSTNLKPYSSFNNKQEGSDRCAIPEIESTGDHDEFPAYPPEVLTKMNRIAAAMVSAGYETECCQVYTIARRNAFQEQLKRLEYEKLNIEDVQRMQWEPLEGEVARWIRLVKYCSAVLFPGERSLAESVFSDSPSLSKSIFSNIARAVAIQLLDFAEAVAMTKRSAEKLFKFLDMHETLRDLIPAISESHCSEEWEKEMASEISATLDRIGAAAMNIFCDLENSIRNDVAKTPVPGGAIHPLTRYVMNYLKYACEYKDTLEQIFQQNSKSEGEENLQSDQATSSPFSAQLLVVMDLLDENLEAKSKLYKDISLRNIFLMNNGRYILQKVKGSPEIHKGMGDNWCRRRSTVVRQYHKNYQRETCGRLLQCLSLEGGLLVNGKVCKQVVKERFKNFGVTFDEIHKAQSTWVVSDEQLVSELRVSITGLVIPAYRSFLGRFKQHLDNGRQAEKYIKYQPEDIETLIEGLFEGNPLSMGRRR